MKKGYLTDLILSLIATIAIVFVCNTRFGVVPPLGKFLDPFHGCWQNAESAKSMNDAKLNVEGLKDEVKVYFDERLVPHVFAKNNEDMYFMQGYITAKFRLWQMEIQTHNAAGRLTEIVGEKALETDRMNRRVGLEYGAEAAEAYIEKDPESKKMVDAYCKGVNAYIHSLKPGDYPLEYKLLDYKPEDWTALKVALLLKNMAYQLSIFEYDIENTNFVTKYGMEQFRKLYPDFIDAEAPIVPKGTIWDLKSGISDLKNQNKSLSDKSTAQYRTPNPPRRRDRSLRLGGLGGYDPQSEIYPNVLEKPDEITGSNNWAVSGSKTKSGKPMLCSDPHLKLTLPSIWYEMQLSSPDMNVYGVSLPGALGVIIGFNDSISWGLTNGGRDVRDWYKIKFKDAARNEYEYNGQWLKTEKKVEKYIVRGKGDVLDTVVYTKFGPVVFDESFGVASSRNNLALNWTAHLPSNEFKTFYLLNGAKNYNDYLDALNYYTCPAQNFAFASRSGDIAIKHQGRFPVRDKVTEQGKYISDGSSDKDEWKSFVPNESNPVMKNPERGFVSSANQHPTDSTYPYYYPGLGVYENYRNRRINDLLGPAKDIDVAFMENMQNDVFNLHASEALPVLLSLLDQSSLTDNEKKIVDELQRWKFNAKPDEVAPMYFEIWWNELRRLLWDEMADKTAPMKQPNFYVTVQFLKNDSTSQFYDNLSTPEKETRHDIVLQSFKRIQETLKDKLFTQAKEPYLADNSYIRKGWSPHDWGTYKSTQISHIAGIDALSDLDVYTGGNNGVINASSHMYGPSWRMIVDEGDMKAYVIYPGGQSGNPGSAYYDNMVQDWAAGRYYEANFVKQGADMKEKTLYTLTFDKK